MRVWLLGLAVVVVVVGSGVAIAAATNVLSDDAASEPTHVSYCDAVGAGAPIDEVVSLAPPAVEAVVREVRDAPAGSERALEARNLWAYYNNNHCCDCYDAKQAPEIAALTPEQRARVAAGGAP